MRWRLLIAALVFSLALTSFALAVESTIRLRDGTVLVGELKKYGSSYSIKLPDGMSKMIPASEVVEIDGKPVGDDAVPSVGVPDVKQAPVSGSSALETIKRKADKAEQVIVAMKLWDDWINANPTSADLEAAKAELAKWEDLYGQRAEKIRGKWLVGAELKEIKSRVNQLLSSSFTLVEEGDKVYRTVDGVKGLHNLEEVLKIYPQSFEANFSMGYYHLVQITRLQGSNRQIQKSLASLEAAREIRPDIAEVWSNLAIIYNFLRQYEKSVDAAWRAAQINDTKDIVQQLATALYSTPPAFLRVNRRVAQIEGQAKLLFQKHSIAGPSGWLYLQPDFDTIAKGSNNPDLPPGLRGHGSGFFITPDGYLLTNRHVVGDTEGPAVPEPDTVFRIRLDDGKEKMATIIAIDDKWDMALLKVQVDQPVPYLKIAASDPLEGTRALVLGYPATGLSLNVMMFGEGIVKTVTKDDIYHVWYDLNTTNGNSGGPIVDPAGNLISIISAGRTAEGTSNNFTYVLGLGPDQIEDFFTRIGDKAPKNIEYVDNNVEMPPFDTVSLIAKCRKPTVLVMSINTKSIDAEATVAEEIGSGNKDGRDDKKDDKPEDEKPEGEPDQKTPEGSSE